MNFVFVPYSRKEFASNYTSVLLFGTHYVGASFYEQPSNTAGIREQFKGVMMESKEYLAFNYPIENLYYYKFLTPVFHHFIYRAKNFVKLSTITMITFLSYLIIA